MVETAKPIRLNLGCGFAKLPGYTNVDGWDNCEPDVVWDLDRFPYPWETNSITEIQMHHVLEHTSDWWGVFCECCRILKPGGMLEIRVPDESSATALTYRDHHHVFSLASFHGIQDAAHGTNAWAKTVQDTIPLRLEAYYQVPFPKYAWMPNWLLGFVANHMRNFIHEQRFIFRKIGPTT